jgi:hypothetical protein
MTSEQLPPVKNGHNFWIPRAVVVHRFSFIFRQQLGCRGILNVLKSLEYRQLLKLTIVCTGVLPIFLFVKSRSASKLFSLTWSEKALEVATFFCICYL